MKPIEVLALIEHDLQRADPHEKQEESYAVDRQFARWSFLRLEVVPAEHRTYHAYRHINEKNPRPHIVVGYITAEQGAGDRGDESRDGPHRQSRAALVGPEHADEQCLTAGNHGPRHAALEHAKGDQGRQTPG